jgi:hypothetical protein
MGASMNNQAFFIGHLRSQTKRAVCLGWLLAIFYVRKAMRGPQALEFVGDTSKGRS